MESAVDSEGFLIEPAPQYRLPYSNLDLAAAHADVAKACPHRRTYVVAGRVFCNACGRKVGQETEDE